MHGLDMIEAPAKLTEENGDYESPLRMDMVEV